MGVMFGQNSVVQEFRPSSLQYAKFDLNLRVALVEKFLE